MDSYNFTIKSTVNKIHATDLEQNKHHPSFEQIIFNYIEHQVSNG